MRGLAYRLCPLRASPFRVRVSGPRNLWMQFVNCNYEEMRVEQGLQSRRIYVRYLVSG
jgi:hypothetical protein